MNALLKYPFQIFAPASEWFAPLDEHPRGFGGNLVLARLPPRDAAPKPLKEAINVICREMINRVMCVSA